MYCHDSIAKYLCIVHGMHVVTNLHKVTYMAPTAVISGVPRLFVHNVGYVGSVGITNY